MSTCRCHCDAAGGETIAARGRPTPLRAVAEQEQGSFHSRAPRRFGASMAANGLYGMIRDQDPGAVAGRPDPTSVTRA